LIYLDHAATSPLRPEALRAMMPYLEGEFGNPSSLHGPGRRARVAVERAREQVATVLGCAPGEVVFTSGGTEANNAALFGVLGDSPSAEAGLITTAAEHHAVLAPARTLRERGRRVTILTPTETGSVSVASLDGLVHPGDLASVMWVNNEVGTISPVRDLADAAREAGGIVHTDAVQAAGHLPLNVDDLGVDLLSLSGHKVGGPKGVGVLYVRAGAPWRPFVRGGSQERARRGGTENVAGVVGLAVALEHAEAEREALRDVHIMLRNRLVERLDAELGAHLHVHTPGVTTQQPGMSSAHILSVSVTGREGRAVDGEMLLVALDMEGVCVSAGSACTSGALEPSHVLRAMGVPDDVAQATVRFSLGLQTTAADVDGAAEALVRVLRRMNAVG
jgi:cysteine desulfurase